jgi:hypothetical protein
MLIQVTPISSIRPGATFRTLISHRLGVRISDPNERGGLNHRTGAVGGVEVLLGPSAIHAFRFPHQEIKRVHPDLRVIPVPDAEACAITEKAEALNLETETERTIP